MNLSAAETRRIQPDDASWTEAAAAGPTPIAVLGWLFRPLAALGSYHSYMNYQHRFHARQMQISTCAGTAPTLASR